MVFIAMLPLMTEELVVVPVLPMFIVILAAGVVVADIVMPSMLIPDMTGLIQEVEVTDESIV